MPRSTRFATARAGGAVSRSAGQQEWSRRAAESRRRAAHSHRQPDLALPATEHLGRADGGAGRVRGGTTRRAPRHTQPQFGPKVAALARRLVHGALPQRARLDAAHVAVAAVNGMDFLLNWNFRHLANAALRWKDSKLYTGTPQPSRQSSVREKYSNSRHFPTRSVRSWSLNSRVVSLARPTMDLPTTICSPWLTGFLWNSIGASNPDGGAALVPHTSARRKVKRRKRSRAAGG